MIYTKYQNGRQVFSSCKTIELNGRWISNPTEEQITEAGWEQYIPPEIPDTPITEPTQDELLGAVKSMLKKDIDILSDEEALSVAALYPTWIEKIGQDLIVGDRLWYDGSLYKVIQAHTAQDDWTPSEAVSLFTKVSISEYPDWVQPTGATDAYNKGDKVTYDGKHWISTADANVWQPGVYGWEEI